MATFLLKTLPQKLQTFPQLHHCPGVEFAVGEEGLPAGIDFFSYSLLLRKGLQRISHHQLAILSLYSLFGQRLFQLLQLGEDSHRITAVLATLVEVMVVQFGIIGEEGRQHALDAKRASHSGNISASSWRTSLESHPTVRHIQPSLLHSPGRVPTGSPPVIGNVLQVRSKVGVQSCQLTYAPTFEHLIIC